MSPKEQFDACMKIADFAAGRWDERRDYDWKFTVGIWGIIAAGIAFARIEQLPWWIGAIVVAFYAVWQRSVWIRNTEDSKIVWNSITAANAIVKQFSIDVVPPKSIALAPKISLPFYRAHLGFLTDWASSIQIMATAVLVAMFYAVSVKEVTWWKIVGIAVER